LCWGRPRFAAMKAGFAHRIGATSRGACSLPSWSLVARLVVIPWSLLAHPNKKNQNIGRIRREHLIKGKSIKEIARDLKISRNTVR
jgi:hypothetical protein